ncbi:MAG: hypothetical protein OK439_03445 [Thaumarchaeota archaeon]|nr:hypothetical protein [Nitrososphaerota archaeon]
MSSGDSSSGEKSAKAILWAFNISGGVSAGSQPAGGYGTALRIHMNALANEEEEGARPETKEFVAETKTSQSQSKRAALGELLHRRLETISPNKFVDGAETFLTGLGLLGPTRIEINYDPLPENGELKNLSDELAMCRSYLDSNTDKVKTVDIGSHGMSTDFNLRLSMQYLRKHLLKEPSIKVGINLLSKKLGPNEGETFQQYKERMKKLDQDKKASSALYAQIDSRRKEFYSMLTQSLEECFPSCKAQVYEDIVPNS